LRKLCISDKFIDTIMDTLRNISTQFRVGDSHTKSIALKRGVRQGDPLSATLCVCVLDPILKIINREFRDNPEFEEEEHRYLTGAHAYADYFDLVFTSHTAMMLAFERFKQISQLASLTINSEKSTYAYSA
jgi:hypothetical protein